MDTLIAKLTDIQSELKATKSRYNKFGNFSYRNVEDIYESLKPFLKKHGLVLKLQDSIEAVLDRVYVKAEAILTDGKNEISASAYAREIDVKKGMDEAQITGSASSYARKYAVSGLFLLDDNQDVDSIDNSTSHEHKKEEPKKIVKAENIQSNDIKNRVKSMLLAFEGIGVTEVEVLAFVKKSNISEIDIKDLEYLTNKYKELKKK